MVYVSPSSCDETLIAMARVAGVALACDLCHHLLCAECYNCHNRRCRQYCPLEEGHGSAR